MQGILNIILSVVALLILGAFATFFMLLDIKKDEIWEEIHRRYLK